MDSGTYEDRVCVTAQTIAIGAYETPTRDSEPFAITAGPDYKSDGLLRPGRSPSTRSNGSFIGRITTAGAISYYPLGTDYYGFDPSGITPGPDGALFPVSSDRNGQIKTGGPMGRCGLPALSSGGLGRIAGVWAEGIASGPDGDIWFTEAGGNNIGHMTAAGVVTEYPIPTANSSPLQSLERQPIRSAFSRLRKEISWVLPPRRTAAAEIRA